LVKEGVIMKMPILNTRGFIFDIDGTLLDSNDAHAECLQIGLIEHGYSFEFQYIRKLIGMGMDKILPKLIGISAESESGKAIALTKNECFKIKFLKLKAFPGVKKLIGTLYARDFKLTVASSASASDLQKSLQKLEIEDFFSTTVSAEDVSESKPDPEPMVIALQKIELKPEDAVMVGDTRYDIEAALRAGVRPIALRTGRWPDEELQRAKLILNDPAELLQYVIDQKITNG
jgi:HAD superfamily hydrolase (TIGR01549 family)